MSDQRRIGEIIVDISRKRVKNLSLRVLPPSGTVKVTIPLHLNYSAAEEFIKSKEHWIKKQQEKIRQKDYDTDKHFVDGEKHLIFGSSLVLKLHPVITKEGVTINNGDLHLFTKYLSDRNHNELILENWYRENLSKNLPSLISKWESKLEVKLREFKIRKMKTRWGTCNPRAGRIWFSLMLAKQRPEIVEYIVVHELVHLLEASHNKRFYRLMDSYLPNWKELRKELR